MTPLRFIEVYQIEADFQAKVEAEFNKMIEGIVSVEERNESIRQQCSK